MHKHIIIYACIPVAVRSAAPSRLEALAIAALRRWCAERQAIRNGIVSNTARQGWTPRDSRTADAKLVRVLSFEAIFSRLDDREQTALLLAYRDGLPPRHVATALHCTIPNRRPGRAGAHGSSTPAPSQWPRPLPPALSWTPSAIENRCSPEQAKNRQREE